VGLRDDRVGNYMLYTRGGSYKGLITKKIILDRLKDTTRRISRQR
jgi:hypothetical protein